MIGVNKGPGFSRLQRLVVLVDKVASFAVVAVALFGECMASFGLVGSIMFHVDPQLLRAVSELALLPVCAVSFLGEIFAE
jgi:hypothetical protein